MSVSELLDGAFDGVAPDLSIEPGMRVRSYDFAGNISCFVEGQVTRITEPMEGCPRYCIRVERRVFDGKVVESGADEVFPPVNGTPTMLGKLTNFVVRLAEH